MGPSGAWVIVALAAGIVELLSPTFGFVFVSAAALAAAGLAAAGATLVWQLCAFAVVLLASLLFLRPRLVGRLGAQGVAGRTDALVGRLGVVTAAVDPVSGLGRVEVSGQDWAARCDSPLAPGAGVRVTGADGIVLLVEPAQRPE